MEGKSSKIVRYIDVDVYTEAKKRIGHVLDTFDAIAVCFSGGKDSLATLHLVEEVYRERGITEPINVIFRDEELIPDDVINFVQRHVTQPQYRFFYYAVQLRSHKFILGKTYEYIQWDEGRRWLREKPPYAITAPGMVFDQYTMDAFAGQNFTGKIAFMTGIRADESLIRLRSCINKQNENYINATGAKNVHLVKPIYDWSQMDVFKYFHDQGIQYCPIYDLQAWNQQALRVATPLHAEYAKIFSKIRTLYPVFYQQLVDIFPEMLVQERYWKDFSPAQVVYRYRHGWNGIIEYIREHIQDDAERQMAIKRVLMAKKIRENNIAKGVGLHNYGGYPILYVFKTILAGQFKRVIQPKKTPSEEEVQYELKTAERVAAV